MAGETQFDSGKDHGTIIVDQKSSFKLTRGQRGGYGWEIRIVDDDIESLKTKTEALDRWAKEKYGGAT